ncbi:MAG: BON domain-containing protein [Bryobacterales bacterium]|nr:BON domain-containing protein [Bryobacterales bacterium]
MKLFSLFVATLITAVGFAQPPDNTKINKRDNAADAVTAGMQSNKKEDLDLVRKIRRGVTADKSMSTYARNVKIITRDGVATLRGPVKSAAEKMAIETIAKRIAGDTKVESHLEIVPPK